MCNPRHDRYAKQKILLLSEYKRSLSFWDYPPNGFAHACHMLFSAVTSIDTSGIETVCELKKILMKKSLQVCSMWLKLCLYDQMFSKKLLTDRHFGICFG